MAGYGEGKGCICRCSRNHVATLGRQGNRLGKTDGRTQV